MSQKTIFKRSSFKKRLLHILGILHKSVELLDTEIFNIHSGNANDISDVWRQISDRVRI